MLKGVKFVPREALERQSSTNEGQDKHREGKEKSKHHKRKSHKRHSIRRKYSSSSSLSEESQQPVRKSSKRKQKWDTSSASSESESHWEGKKSGKKVRCTRTESNTSSSDEPKKRQRSTGDLSLLRKEVGLDWMLQPLKGVEKKESTNDATEASKEIVKEERPRENPKELNPFWRDGGTGFPEESQNLPEKEATENIQNEYVVGDGGASWRLKALKRAQEQAAREGQKLDEVVEERWGSLAQMTASVVTTRAASFHAHLHAIKDRKKEYKGIEDSQVPRSDQGGRNDVSEKYRYSSRHYLKDFSAKESMRAPKISESLTWKNRRKVDVSHPETADVIKDAANCLNKFSNDGSFLEKLSSLAEGKLLLDSSFSEAKAIESESAKCKPDSNDNSSQLSVNPQDTLNDKGEALPSHNISSSNMHGLSANQLAAKAMKLRLQGKHAEADVLLKEAQNVSNAEGHLKEQVSFRVENTRHQGVPFKKNLDDDYDAHMASKIISNRQYSAHKHADDEYDYDDHTKGKQKPAKNKQQQRNDLRHLNKHIVTQQERCQFCFDNPSRPKHLTIAIANLTYLMIPAWEPVVDGHCCILPMQHEASTRNLDDSEWEELRNFKKCLLKMYAKEDKDVIFLETAMGFSQQRRHCMIDCIPLPSDIAEEAPLYFKQAIDEAEEEWSQHNAKKLIDTSIKGLRGSIPKNFPYFHVEFGMSKGFVHVIDDEKNFKNQFGLNVIRGMLQLQDEDMYRRRRRYSLEMQNSTVASFAKKWEPYDWTKMLD